MDISGKYLDPSKCLAVAGNFPSLFGYLILTFFNLIFTHCYTDKQRSDADTDVQSPHNEREVTRYDMPT